MRATDEAEFKAYAAARMRDVRRTAFLLCGDWHHADDVTQTVFTKLYVNWEKVHKHDRPTSLLEPVEPPRHRPRRRRLRRLIRPSHRPGLRVRLRPRSTG